MSGGQKFPMRVTFTTPASADFTENMYIRITLESGLISAYSSTEPYFCNFKAVVSKKEVRCKIDDSYTSIDSNDVYFTVTTYTGQTLVQNSKYELEINRHDATNGLNGLEFTSSA